AGGLGPLLVRRVSVVGEGDLAALEAAGRLEGCLGLGRVVDTRLATHVGLVTVDDRGDPAGGGLTRAVEDGLDDGLTVDRHGDGLADLRRVVRGDLGRGRGDSLDDADRLLEVAVRKVGL